MATTTVTNSSQPSPSPFPASLLAGFPPRNFQVNDLLKLKNFFFRQQITHLHLPRLLQFLPHQPHPATQTDPVFFPTAHPINNKWPPVYSVRTITRL